MLWPMKLLRACTTSHDLKGVRWRVNAGLLALAFATACAMPGVARIAARSACVKNPTAYKSAGKDRESVARHSASSAADAGVRAIPTAVSTTPTSSATPTRPYS